MDPVGAVLKADQMRVIISLNKGNHMVVLNSNTGIVSATISEMALSLDWAHLQAPSVEEEGIIRTGLIVRFSSKYDNCLIVQSSDKRPCTRCKAGVNVVRMDFFPHFLSLVVNINS